MGDVQTYKASMTSANNILSAKQRFQKDVVSNGYYKVADKNIESAALINAMAIEANIKVKVQTWKNDSEAGCKATCWIGDENNPIAKQQRTVRHLYKDKYEEKLLEFIKNNCLDRKDRNGYVYKKASVNIETDIEFQEINGIPYPRIINPAVHLNFLLEWNRFKAFSDRDAETKAISRAQRALLGVEFRDKEEIESEKEEIEGIAKSNNKKIDDSPDTSGHNETSSNSNDKLKELFEEAKNNLRNYIQEKHLSWKDMRRLFHEKYGIALDDNKDVGKLRNFLNYLMNSTESDVKKNFTTEKTNNVTPNTKPTELSEIEAKIEERKNVLLENKIASKSEINMMLQAGNKNFMEWSEKKIQAFMEAENDVVDTQIDNEESQEPPPQNGTKPTNSNPLETHPLKWIGDLEAKGTVTKDMYQKALYQYFINNDMADKYSSAINVYKLELGIEQPTKQLYKTMIDYIRASEGDFIKMISKLEINNEGGLF